VSPFDELNVRLGWTIRAGWNVSVIGQNLLHAYHPELFTSGGPQYAFKRGFYVRTGWHF
jgi:hypothetical protein